MELKDVKEWQCDGERAIAVNPYPESNINVFHEKWQLFESQSKLEQNQPRTTLSGLYKAEDVELSEVWEYKPTIGSKWGIELDCRKTLKSFEEYKSYVENTYQGKYATRLTYELVLKPIKEEITINLNDYSISMEDLERAFCYGYLANPDNKVRDNVELMRRWQICKDSFITPMLINKHIID